ncbi:MULTISPECIES: phosphatase domain-containing protein [unclassified Leptolyngbya]|uniref:App1 family protein n=1 Tax=unclassified Leptolyngbya TaxID=2650499 RepID=UPI00168765D4|nr:MULTISPECIES: phosphatase domain-containing protein [unclassified Leptolyngbya]MBD1909684.1 DUF2183 domain-containing protein [Leptolyngbya sp. FACHB-8]MBD2157539.1 DUF2183 domain-containing protein [Leptolyngbya sp. FACHB-16]
MTDWIRAISQGTATLNDAYDAVKGKITRLLRLEDPIQIMAYRGYGTPEWLFVKGRVLQDQGIKIRETKARLLENVVNMYRRFATDEVPKARLRVSLGDIYQEVVTDREGFFETELRPSSPLESDRLWERIDLELLHPLSKRYGAVRDRGQVLIVREQARFGVISDIDDTIVETAATDLLKMIRIAYLGNAQTRKPFDGVPEFYHGLQRGVSGKEGNPIFYVSSSAWNMYDVFEQFMDIKRIPPGPILLRDIELSLENLLSFKHEIHKIEQIRPIFERFPHLPFILIGDTGQRDAEIYQNLVQTYPDRILGVYLRDVTPNNTARHEILKTIEQTIRDLSCSFLVFQNTQDAIEHAARQGWLEPEKTLVK